VPSVSRAPRDRGELAIVLHSHMPYVEGFGTWPFGEEWLFEAMASAYLPLVDLCERWAAQGRDGVLTVGVTPVLADQLELGEVAERFQRFIGVTRADGHRADSDELERRGEREAAAALRSSASDYERALERFDAIGEDFVGAFRRLRDAGTIELWTSAATHAVLPLVATEGGLRLQLATGIASHRRRFGRWSGGFWLPECAFRPGLEEPLACAGVSCFCMDQSGGDALDQLEPAEASGAAALPIDWRTISLVWDERGYPSAAVYRDYHATSTNGLRPWSNGGQPYLTEPAGAQARAHAREFVAQVEARLDSYRSERGRPGLVVCALDTELLGHWWYEGPVWLEAVVEEAECAGLALATLPEALERHEPRRRALVESSWGAGKDLGTWDSPAVAELAWLARRAELALCGVLAARPAGERERDAADRAARELLALQASDWAFMATRGLAGDYPFARAQGHVGDFERALASLERSSHGSSNGPASTASAEPEESLTSLPRRRFGRRRVDAELRGLAPSLRFSSLLEPPSAWGRNGAAR
jgi:1,4-alpha-glucan branching enzyme